jgi:hypothetical protein
MTRSIEDLIKEQQAPAIADPISPLPSIILTKSGLVGKNGEFISPIVKNIHFAHPTRLQALGIRLPKKK